MKNGRILFMISFIFLFAAVVDYVNVNRTNDIYANIMMSVDENTGSAGLSQESLQYDEYTQQTVDYEAALQKEISEGESEYVKPLSQEVVDFDGVIVPILVYHNVKPSFKGQSALSMSFTATPAVMEKELQYLNDNGYTAISMDTLVAALNGKSILPEKPYVINFDDGWESQYTNAVPILKKFGVTATFFVWTNAIDHKDFMTWNQLKELQSLGMTIGAHTLTHSMLDRFKSDKSLRAEIFDSKRIIEEKTGKPVNYFAYPFGVLNARILAFVKEAGYTAARGIKNKAIQTVDDMFTLNAFLGTNNYVQFERYMKSLE